MKKKHSIIMMDLFGRTEQPRATLKPLFDHHGEVINMPSPSPTPKLWKSELVDFLKKLQTWQFENVGAYSVGLETDYDPVGKYLCWIRLEVEYLSEKFEVEDGPEKWEKDFLSFLGTVKEQLGD